MVVAASRSTPVGWGAMMPATLALAAPQIIVPLSPSARIAFVQVIVVASDRCLFAVFYRSSCEYNSPYNRLFQALGGDITSAQMRAKKSAARLRGRGFFTLLYALFLLAAVPAHTVRIPRVSSAVRRP